MALCHDPLGCLIRELDEDEFDRLYELFETRSKGFTPDDAYHVFNALCDDVSRRMIVRTEAW